MEELKSSAEAPVKPAWQAQKESVYEKLPVTVRQLDIIIGLAVAGLVIVAILIALDAMNIIYIYSRSNVLR